MGFDTVVLSLIMGGTIFRTSVPDLHYKIGKGSDEPILVMWSPGPATHPAMPTSFFAEDILANDWAVAP